MQRHYLTTPIYYTNGDPHIGHAHTTIMADILKRAAQLKGTEVFLTTGTDEHGQKNQEAASAADLAPQQYLDIQSAKFRALFERLNIGFDHWVRTSSNDHKRGVQEALSRLNGKGLIIKKDYSGLYCLGCEQFKKSSDLDEQGRCPDHLVAPAMTTETNYFLKLQDHQDWLRDRIQDSPDWIKPELYRRGMLGMLDSPLEDLCISRPKSRVSLGVEVPFDTDYVTYVWFDALMNYLTSLGWPDGTVSTWWPTATHLMAKDIAKTHCIYWPIILRVLGVEPPAAFRIHGFWVGEGGIKMSKSLGNAVVPDELANLVGVDGLRFYLAKSMKNIDAEISEKLVVAVTNADLANNLGNLYARLVKFAIKNYQNTVPVPSCIDPTDEWLRRWIVEEIQVAYGSLDLTTISSFVNRLLGIADRMNAHLTDVGFWSLVRQEGAKERLDSIVYVGLDCLRLLFEAFFPVIPATSDRALKNLGLAPLSSLTGTHEFAPGRLAPGTALGDDTNYFPRIKLPNG
jgi:methionyl-tRNA synthetase